MYRDRFNKVSLRARILLAVLFLMSLAFFSSVTKPDFYKEYVNEYKAPDLTRK